MITIKNVEQLVAPLRRVQLPATTLGKHFDKAATQYRWSIANLVVATLCMVLAAGAFMTGHAIAGLTILATSLAAVWNSDAHKKRGDVFAREARRIE